METDEAYMSPVKWTKFRVLDKMALFQYQNDGSPGTFQQAIANQVVERSHCRA